MGRMPHRAEVETEVQEAIPRDDFLVGSCSTYIPGPQISDKYIEAGSLTAKSTLDVDPVLHHRC